MALWPVRTEQRPAGSRSPAGGQSSRSNRSRNHRSQSVCRLTPSAAAAATSRCRRSGSRTRPAREGEDDVTAGGDRSLQHGRSDGAAASGNGGRGSWGVPTPAGGHTSAPASRKNWAPITQQLFQVERIDGGMVRFHRQGHAHHPLALAAPTDGQDARGRGQRSGTTGGGVRQRPGQPALALCVVKPARIETPGKRQHRVDAQRWDHPATP